MVCIVYAVDDEDSIERVSYLGPCKSPRPSEKSV